MRDLTAYVVAGGVCSLIATALKNACEDPGGSFQGIVG
jgi:hypothetical protein